MAEKHLIATCPPLAAWIHQIGKCTLEPYWTREPYEALIRAIAHQQLHGKAAEAILGRLIASSQDGNFPSAQFLVSMRRPRLRSFGFSDAKVEAIRGIARASVDGILPDRKKAESTSDEELIHSLTQLRGIGRWTVEMFLIFTLGRLDVMPVDDFGIKAGLRHLYHLEASPKKKDFEAKIECWKPFRSIGAWYLWRLADAHK